MSTAAVQFATLRCDTVRCGLMFRAGTLHRPFDRKKSAWHAVYANRFARIRTMPEAEELQHVVELRHTTMKGRLRMPEELG